MKKFLFIKEDYDDFCKKIEEIQQKIREITVTIGTVVDGSGDQWHDALLYQTQEMSESWSKELRRLLEIQNHAQIVTSSPPRDGKVRFGKVVTVVDLDIGETFLLEISSYIISEKSQIKNNLKRISYASPLGQLLLGAEVGEIREGRIGATYKKFKVLQINEKNTLVRY